MRGAPRCHGDGSRESRPHDLTVLPSYRTHGSPCATVTVLSRRTGSSATGWRGRAPPGSG
eukprot:264610-Hanusia_phi.AAC.2